MLAGSVQMFVGHSLSKSQSLLLIKKSKMKTLKSKFQAPPSLLKKTKMHP